MSRSESYGSPASRGSVGQRLPARSSSARLSSDDEEVPAEHRRSPSRGDHSHDDSEWNEVYAAQKRLRNATEDEAAAQQKSQLAKMQAEVACLQAQKAEKEKEVTKLSLEAAVERLQVAKAEWKAAEAQLRVAEGVAQRADESLRKAGEKVSASNSWLNEVQDSKAALIKQLDAAKAKVEAADAKRAKEKAVAIKKTEAAAKRAEEEAAQKKAEETALAKRQKVPSRSRWHSGDGSQCRDNASSSRSVLKRRRSSSAQQPSVQRRAVSPPRWLSLSPQQKSASRRPTRKWSSSRRRGSPAKRWSQSRKASLPRIRSTRTRVSPNLNSESRDRCEARREQFAQRQHPGSRNNHTQKVGCSGSTEVQMSRWHSPLRKGSPCRKRTASDRQSRPRSKSQPRRSRSPVPNNHNRSKSRSQAMRLSTKMPHNTPATWSGETIEAEVLERPTLSSGEPVWQASIEMSQGGINHAGRTRVFTIRGPPRKTRDQAERDAKQLTEVSNEGPKAVRTLANHLHRPNW